MLLTDKRIQRRALKAVRDCPFKECFYQAINKKGLNAKDIFLKREKYLKKGFFSFNTKDSIEAKLVHLIQVGVLRREVDGQGLTSKVRLTPLGRDIIKKTANLLNNKTNLLKKVLKCLLK